MAKVEVRITVKPEKSGIKKAKAKLRKRLDDNGISLKEILSREQCTVSYQAVKKAFSVDDYYWNQSLMNLAQDMIEEKKQAINVNKRSLSN